MPLTPPTESTTVRQGLDRLLGGRDSTEFLATELGEHMLHQKGEPDRWADLFSWTDLNALLNQDIISVPEVRLMKRSTAVNKSHYTYQRDERVLPDAALCQRQMAEGATLIVQGVDRANPRLAAFANSLKQEFNAEVFVDAVITCASVPGLNLHWDAYECFNIQIAGEKEWQVTPPARPYPSRSTKAFRQRTEPVETEAPAGPPAWTGIVAPGDLIYLPRGWWHGVTPHVVPSLHLSIAVDLPTLGDLLDWHVETMKQLDFIRRPIPCWGTEETRQSFAKQAASELAPLTPSSNTIDMYLAHLRTTARPKADFSLPSAASPTGPSLRASTLVRLRTDWLPFDVAGGRIRIEWRGLPLEFTDQVVPIVDALNREKACRFEQLARLSNPMIVSAFLLSLAGAGVISIANDDQARGR
jgi:hypothetical protein